MADAVETSMDICSKQTYKYIPATPPNPLIDSSSFSIDFKTRKFLQVGIDSEKNFDVMIHIITSSRHIVISRDFLNQLFSLMGTILSYILDRPVLYKRKVFLETDENTLSSMVYREEKVLIIQSKIENEQRVILELNDLMTIQSMEWSIFETIVRKTDLVKPMVLHQVNQISLYLNKFDIPEEAASIEKLETWVKNIDDSKIIDNVVKNEFCFISQIKSLVVNQLAKKWMSLMNKPDKSYDVCEPQICTPPTTPVEHYSSPSPTQVDFKLEYYSPPSPAQITNDTSLSIVYEPQSCYSPMSPPSYSEQSENDGPSFYDLIHIPSPRVSPTEFPEPRAKRPEKAKYVYPRQTKRVQHKSLFQNMLYDE